MIGKSIGVGLKSIIKYSSLLSYRVVLISVFLAIVALLMDGLTQAYRTAPQQEQQFWVKAEMAHHQTVHLLKHKTNSEAAALRDRGYD